MNNIDFAETQRFSRWWAWAAVIVFNILFLYAFVQQVIMGKPFGSKPATNMQLILAEFIPLFFLILLISIRLKTSFNNEGISYRYYPFQFTTTFIAWHELSDAYMREYNSLYEYGGWGIRVGTAKTGNALNTSQSCKTGLQLKFKNGRLLLIGTRRPEELKVIIDEVIAAGKINRGI
jgi:hypothetical protein